ncbi:TPA: hypothetical protein ACH3X1_002030 [Trebouxia sp. C0004]
MRSMNATAFAVIVLLCLTGTKAKRGLLQEEVSAPVPDVSVFGAALESAPTGSQAPTTVLSAGVPTAGPAGGPASLVATPQSEPASYALPAPAEGPPALGADVAPAPSNSATASVTAAPSQLPAAAPRVSAAIGAPAPAPSAVTSGFGVIPIVPFIPQSASIPAPAPAPALASVLAPLFAPAIAPVVAPIPIIPPVCSSKPMCRLFVENQLCCQSEGLLTSATYANVRVLCNQPVNLAPECLSIDGPTNFTTVDVLNANTSNSHQYFVNYQESNYNGHVNIDLQRQRNNTAVDCSLNFSPCTFDGILYNTIPVMQDLGFNVMDPMDFAEGYVGCPAYAALDLLQNWGYMRVNSTQCGEQMTGDLPMDFFVSAWQTYDGGFQNDCNVTANLLGLEAFNGTDSIIELEQYNAVTPGAATNQEAAALQVITLGT